MNLDLQYTKWNELPVTKIVVIASGLPFLPMLTAARVPSRSRGYVGSSA